MDEFRYTNHLDTLLALTTYLALTAERSRTPANLAKDLSLPEASVRLALATFPGIFRKSQRTDPGGEHFYTLHARYALRKAQRGQGEDGELELRSDALKVLLDFISDRAQQETAFEHLQRTLRQTRLNAFIAATAALVAAAASVTAAVLAR